MISDSITTESLVNVLGKIMRAKRKELAIWDVDDTLFATPAKHLKIKVVDRITHKPIIKGGKVLSVTSHDFADEEKLNKFLDEVKGCLVEPVSFLAFRNAKIFRKHAKAIEENLKHALRDYNNNSKFFMMLTARANMNDKKPFLEHFAEHGLNMDTNHSHVVRTRSVTATAGAKGKKEVMSAILRKATFIKKVDFWDDSSGNIAAFKTLASEFPNVELVPHHIKK
jgi:hypothetical protein